MSRWMRLLRRPLSAVLAMAYLSGCGVIFNGTRQSVSANSTPEAAKVTTSPVTGEYQTPIVLNLERKKSYTIRFEREGYSSATVEIQNRLNPIILILDIVLLPSLIPIIVDAATGAWYRLKPDNALVVMTRLAQGDGPEKILVGVSREGAGGAVDIVSSATGVRLHVEERE